MMRALLMVLLAGLSDFHAIGQPGKDDQLAMMFYREGNYEKAAALFQDLYDEKPNQYYYTYLLFSLVEAADYKEAEKVVRSHMRRNKGQGNLLVDLGYVFIRQGDIAEAGRHFQEALDELGGSRGEVISLANAFMSRQQMDYALEAYKRGRQLNKEYPFRIEIAQIYERLGRFPEMLNEYMDLLDEDPSSISTVQNKMQSALADDPEGTRNEIFRETLLRKVQRDPSRLWCNELLLWHAVQQRDFGMALIQATALDKRMGEDGKRVYDLALLAASNKDYEVAIDALDYVIRKGEMEAYFMPATISHLQVRFESVMERFDYNQQSLLSLEREHEELLAEFGYNEGSLPLLMNLAKLKAYYLDKPGEAIALLEDAKSLAGLPAARQAEIKLQLGDIYLFTGEVWEATLLYSQVDKAFKNDPVGHMAKLKNARLSFYIGEFDWARAQLDVLKAATSKLIANDAMDLSLIISDNQEDDTTQVALRVYAQADLLLFRNKVDSAMALLNYLQSAYTYHPIQDEVLMKQAEIQMRLQDYPAADSLYALVLERFGQDIYGDDALYNRALLAEERFHDREAAMAFYEKLMFDYPGSLFVVDARKRFRKLRGDILN